MIGQAFYCANSAIQYQVLAGMSRYGPRICWVDPHCTMTQFCNSGGPQLRLLTLHSLQADADLAITQARTAADCNGVLSTWETEVLSPGRGPGMQGPGVSAVLVHTLTLHGAAAQQALFRVRGELTDHGSETAGAVLSVWAESGAADAVLVPVATGPAPAAVAALEGVASKFHARPIFMGDSLFLAGASRPHRNRQTQANARVGHGALAAPPWSGNAEGYPLFSDCTGVRPFLGHAALWLVDTGGLAMADTVARAIAARFAREVIAWPVHALHPDLQIYVSMVAVRAPPMAGGRMQAFVLATQNLHISGRRCRVYPFTVTMEPGHNAPRPPVAAEQVHDATFDRRGRLGLASATHGLVVRREATGV